MADSDETRERRQLTIVFCDLVDATSLSDALDPEDYGDLVQSFRAACERVVEDFNGHVAQYLGDGILLYFGYPTAQEDAAVRALRAALCIVESVSGMNATCRLPEGRSIQVRLGAHTGVVVTAQEGAVGRGSELALGSTPNIAARLQALAAPNSVVISQDSYRLTSGFFDFEPLGERSLKGVSEPVFVYRVCRSRPVSSRFEAALSSGLSPLFGRDEVLAQLCEIWTEVTSGRGQTVAIRGDAGVGKSRLVHELSRSLEPEPTWIQAACSEQAQNRAFYCVGRAVEHLAAIATADDSSSSLLKLERTLETYGLMAPEQLQLCAALLDIRLPPDRDIPLGLSPVEIRSQTISVLVELFRQVARTGPLMMCFEDLHWVDPSSRELIVRLMDEARAHPFLCLCTFRPTYRLDYQATATNIDLTPLRIPEIRALTAHLLNEDSSARVVERIAKLSDGIPLFAEELARAALDVGSSAAPPSSQVPATLQDSLMARLDRLPEGKRVAQLASVCGRQFSDALLDSTAVLDGQATARGVTQLLEAGIFRCVKSNTLAFSHALVQDAAYGSLLKRTRRLYHQLVAEALLREFPATEKNEPELIAHHFFECGDSPKAAEYWLRAAQQAADAAASLEAESHLAQARMALTQIVDSDQRNEFELRVQMVSCQLAMSTHGYASPVVETAFTRALELCRSLGHAPSAGTVTKLLASRVLCADDLVKERPGPGPLFWVLWGFGAFHQARAEHRRALQIGERLLEMAAGTPELLVEGHFGAGSSLYYLGEFQAAAEHLEKGWQAYNQAAPSSVSPTGRRAEFLCLGYLSLCLWHLGDVERAAAENARAFQLALAADQVYVAASGYAMRASLLALMQDAAGALEASAKALELADEYGFGFVAIWAKPIFGWALVQTTSEDTGLKMIEEVLTSYGPNTTRIFQTYLLGLAAECHVQFGALSQARACVDEALALAEQTGERFWEPELFRLRGLIELEIPDGSPTLAHRALRRALRQAREQRARSIERRVLQQLMQLAGEGKVEASTLDELAAIYGNTAAQLSHSSSMQ